MTIINDSQKVNLTLQPLTANGKPATVAGVPLWSTSNPAAVSLVVAADGLSAYALSVSLGTSTITAVANADLSGGTREISASIDVQVVPTEAASLTISAGAPESL
jgi:hypothetical protein